MDIDGVSTLCLTVALVGESIFCGHFGGEGQRKESKSEDERQLHGELRYLMVSIGDGIVGFESR